MANYPFLANRSIVLKVWNEYKQQHSVSVLRQEFQQQQQQQQQQQHQSQNSTPQTTRKFALGSYNCPFKAGNMMQLFMNDLIWAIVTNRTLLWEYMVWSCNKDDDDNNNNNDNNNEQKKNSKKKTNNQRGADINIVDRCTNGEEDCAPIFQRADFLPSYIEWKSTLQLPPPLKLKIWSERGNPLVQSYLKNEEQLTSLSDTTNATLVKYPPQWGQNAVHLSTPGGRNALLFHPESKQRAAQLLGGGLDFLYGLLLFECFSLQPTLLNSNNISSNSSNSSNHKPPQLPSSQKVEPYKNGITIVLHSRHVEDRDNGSV